MRKEYLSLREIGRRLDIPPSSVVYYKDRFSRYIPHHAGQGRRVRYPSEALTIFKEIREMFNKNWSAEEIEQELATRFQGMFNDEQQPAEPRSRAEGGEFVQELTGALEKMSGLLENQALFRAEIDSLRNEVLQLRQEKGELEKRSRDRIAQLEQELEALRKERADMVRMFMEHVRQAEDQDQAQEERDTRTGRADKDSATSPPRRFLSLPLVIRSEQGEYLGVTSRSRAFSLQEFIRIIERNSAPDRKVDLAWKRKGKGWSLRIRTKDLSSGQGHEHLMDVEQTLTPSGNTVVELTRLVIDGNTVPDPFLLVLFRKIKDGFDD